MSYDDKIFALHVIEEASVAGPGLYQYKCYLCGESGFSFGEPRHWKRLDDPLKPLAPKPPRYVAAIQRDWTCAAKEALTHR